MGHILDPDPENIKCPLTVTSCDGFYSDGNASEYIFLGLIKHINRFLFHPGAWTIGWFNSLKRLFLTYIMVLSNSSGNSAPAFE